jgi:hypothetical protein
MRRMRLSSAAGLLALTGAALRLWPGGAAALDLPTHSIEAVCRHANDVLFAGSALSPARKTLLEQTCVAEQQRAFDALARLWPKLQVADQQSCLHLVRSNNYVQLARCATDMRRQEAGAAQMRGQAVQP